MTRLAPAIVLAGVALVGAAGAASANGHHDKPDTTHRAVCHPKAGGWVVIAPAQASSHIDERSGAPKHSHDGRVDVYATNGACPPVGSPTTIPTTTPTIGGTPSQPTTTAPQTTATVTVTAPPTSQPTSPSPTSSTPTTDTPTQPTGTTSTAAPSPTSSTRSTNSAKPSRSVTRPTDSAPASPRRSAPSSTVAPPEQLAHTGFNATALAAIGAGLLAAGIALTRKNGAHR